MTDREMIEKKFDDGFDKCLAISLAPSWSRHSGHIWSPRPVHSDGDS